MCPVIFEYGSFQVSGYWFLVAVGLLAAYLYLVVANARLENGRLRR